MGQSRCRRARAGDETISILCTAATDISDGPIMSAPVDSPGDDGGGRQGSPASSARSLGSLGETPPGTPGPYVFGPIEPRTSRRPTAHDDALLHCAPYDYLGAVPGDRSRRVLQEFLDAALGPIAERQSPSAQEERRQQREAQAQADEDARWQRLQAMKEQDADRRARAQAVKERHAAVRLSKMELAAAWKLKRAEREQSEQQRRWEVIERINADRAVSAAEDIRRRSAAIRKGFRLDEFGDVTFVNGEWRVRVADETETGTWMVPGDLRPVIAGSDLDKVAFDTTGPVPEMYPGLCRVPTVPEVLAMERRRSSSRRLTVVSIGHCRPTSGPGSSPANIVWTPGSLATSSSKRIAPLVASRLRTLPTMGHSFGQSADDFVASVPVGIRRPPDRVAMQTPPLLIPSIAWLRQHARPKAQGLHYDHRAYFREALARIAPLYSAGRRRSGSTSCL